MAISVLFIFVQHHLHQQKPNSHLRCSDYHAVWCTTTCSQAVHLYRCSTQYGSVGSGLTVTDQLSAQCVTGGSVTPNMPAAIRTTQVGTTAKHRSSHD
jgi:hypothetical protein